MKLHCAWNSFLQNWDRRIINKIYYYYYYVEGEEEEEAVLANLT